ncbi:MAG: hypothetical protein HY903_23925 [Deltaproteobacteria bacterium]|nr:hypothetical protein [Deltaproteobacteria bacterium]
MAAPAKDVLEALALPKADWEAMLRAAVECYSAGQLAQAATILAGLIAMDKNDARPLKLLASCLLLQDRHREAEQTYERALALDGGDLYTLVALAELKLKALKLADAIPLFEKLFAADPAGTHPAANRGRQLVRAYHDKISRAK